jgi:hypothetical protein
MWFGNVGCYTMLLMDTSNFTATETSTRGKSLMETFWPRKLFKLRVVKRPFGDAEGVYGSDEDAGD